jgi:hypothetical protein
LHGPNQISPGEFHWRYYEPPSAVHDANSTYTTLCPTVFEFSSQLHGSALKRIDGAIKSLVEKSANITTCSTDLSTWCRELVENVKELGQLLALSPMPEQSFCLIDVKFYSILSLHLLSICDSGRSGLEMEEILEVMTCLYGSFFISHSGVVALATAFEDSTLEEMLVSTLVGINGGEFSPSRELRKSQGVYSLASIAHQTCLESSFLPQVACSRLDLACALLMFLDTWRISQNILSLNLRDLDLIRQNSDDITHLCLEMAKICSYNSGREVAPLAQRQN